MFEKIKRWYFLGLWSKQMMQDAVDRNVITAEEAKNITKEENK